ncbi:5'-nucleotidase, lipoprotein e(P4) family [Aequorivita sp. H23M31]|uniref:5'-nucleotidase, lipoprotein e(P4) family n=1 Tax=Aequorivita ciconiae TaxID=2494375 RepID=A0A410G711_9FLAO|nr:5'-nucleotidase, lipoprotein e(P4) family [Aequorivita sp. H23M31]QAA83074.1 5'-nucleotidase, lipoprotein e(P4) family [Aequorivita sp. H23M31]
MKNKSIITLLVFAMLLGCKSQVQESKVDKVYLLDNGIPPREYSIAAVLWQQHSGEYRALAYQAFNLAKMQLDNLLGNKDTFKKPLAIITDIDETILDNSPYSGKQIELKEDYIPERWTEWVDLKKAKPIPGAVEFFNYAKSKGVEVIYISNRTDDQEEATLENLRNVGFPNADSAHILLEKDTSKKGGRRAKVEERYEVIMLIGDNLTDFSSIFENRSTEERNRSVDSLKAAFGHRYIILPNAIYGDWETKGILEGKKDWTTFQKDSIRHKKVISY